MAVAFDAVASTQTNGNISSLTWNHTVGAGSNNYLVVFFFCMLDGTDQSTPTATFNGVAMTALGNRLVNFGSNAHVYAFGLAGVPAGTNQVAIAISGTSGSGNNRWGGGSMSFLGVDQASPLDGTVQTDGQNNSTDCTTNLTVTGANGMVVTGYLGTSSIFGGGPSIAANDGQTEKINNPITGHTDGMGILANPSVGTQSAGWSKLGSNNVGVLVSFLLKQVSASKLPAPNIITKQSVVRAANY